MFQQLYRYKQTIYLNIWLHTYFPILNRVKYLSVCLLLVFYGFLCCYCCFFLFWFIFPKVLGKENACGSTLKIKFELAVPNNRQLKQIFLLSMKNYFVKWKIHLFPFPFLFRPIHEKMKDLESKIWKLKLNNFVTLEFMIYHWLYRP